MSDAASEARAIIERARWPSGPICPNCGSGKVTRLSTRPRLFTCGACRRCQFSATAGTALHRQRLSEEKIVRAVWLLKVRRLALTPSQVAQHLGIAYLTARLLIDKLILLERRMPEFAARLREEVARTDTEKREPTAA